MSSTRDKAVKQGVTQYNQKYEEKNIQKSRKIRWEDKPENNDIR